MYNQSELMPKLFTAINEGKACYISHNSYPVLREFRVKERLTRVPIVIRLESLIVGDFDDEEKPENALADARACSLLSDELKLNWSCQFSGGKGFHFLLKLIPKKYHFIFKKSADDPECSADSLKMMISTLQEFFHHHCRLRTTDPKLIGDA
jgi:hypothetical protein